MEKMIIKKGNREYSLNVDSKSLIHSIRFDYDFVCRYRNDVDYECDCDYNRCHEIKNVQVVGFEEYWLDSDIKIALNEHYEYNEEQEKVDAEDKKSITESFKKIKLSKYVDGEGESDYYGETLNKFWVNYNGFLEELKETLIENGFTIK